MFFDSDLTRLSIETRKIEDQKPEVQQSFDALQREPPKSAEAPTKVRRRSKCGIRWKCRRKWTWEGWNNHGFH